MKNNMKKSYIDAGIFIQAILRDDSNSQKVLSKIIKKELNGVTSILSWDELVFILRKFIDNGTAIKEGGRFLIFPNLIFVDAKKEIILKAQKLIEEYNLKPRDAIHAATALYLNIDEIISEDADFDKIKELKRINPVKV